MDRTGQILGAVTTMLPSVVSLIQTLFKAQHPEALPPTSAEVILAFNSAIAKSLAGDDFWLAAHPPAG